MEDKQDSQMTAGNNTANRINWVDFFKTFSIFLIVLGHAALNHEQLPQFLYLFHVPLFFFISGYLEKTEPCDAIAYVKKTSYALLLPLLIWNLLSAVFHMPITAWQVKDLFASLWNLASWFLSVLFFIKMIALAMKNRKYVIAALAVVVTFILSRLDRTVPVYMDRIFMYLPFFFAGMYLKPAIGRLADKFRGRTAANISITLACLLLLIACFHIPAVPHTINAGKFKDVFYLYWVTGFIGIAGMFFFSLCFDSISSKAVMTISTGTLFIMCSHYEVLQIVTSYISANHGDALSLLFTVLYFALQCALVPLVLRWVPVLAGRKKQQTHP